MSKTNLNPADWGPLDPATVTFENLNNRERLLIAAIRRAHLIDEEMFAERAFNTVTKAVCDISPDPAAFGVTQDSIFTLCLLQHVLFHYSSGSTEVKNGMLE